MPLAKTAEQAVPQVAPITDHPEVKETPIVYDGVPMDMYAYFGLDMHRVGQSTKDKLRDIFEWSRGESPSLGEALIKVRDLESQLGSGGYETKYDKMWRYIRLSQNIKELDKRRESLVAKKV